MCLTRKCQCAKWNPFQFYSSSELKVFSLNISSLLSWRLVSQEDRQMRLQQRWAQYQTELKNIHNNKTRRNYSTWLTAKSVSVTWGHHVRTLHEDVIRGIDSFCNLDRCHSTVTFSEISLVCELQCKLANRILYLWQKGIWESSMTKLCTVSARKIDKYSGRKIYAGQCEKCLLEYSSYLFLFHHTNFHDIYI